jgi:hypothetical protein
MATAVFAETVDNFQYLMWLTPENKNITKNASRKKESQSF